MSGDVARGTKFDLAVGGWVGGATAYLGGATAYLGGATAYLGGATAYLVGGKMNLRIRLTSAKLELGLKLRLSLAIKKTHRIKSKFN